MLVKVKIQVGSNVSKVTFKSWFNFDKVGNQLSPSSIKVGKVTVPTLVQLPQL